MENIMNVNLLNDLRGGCEKAYEAIYKLYAEEVQMKAFCILDNREEAEDVVQDVFLSLFEKRETLIIEKDLKSFLLSAARYKAVDKLRKKASHHKYVREAMYVLTKQQSPSRNLEDKEIIIGVLMGLEKIQSDKYKKAFKLMYFEGCDYKQVAVILGTSVPFSRTYINRALTILRDFLKNSD
jgi:RNA polymerase sigma factor (sigma-70 family)